MIIHSCKNEGFSLPAEELEKALEDAKDAFENFRYSFEQSLKSYMISDLAKAVRKYIQGLQPKWGNQLVLINRNGKCS